MDKALRDGKAPDVVREIMSGDILEQVGVDRKGAPIYGETRNTDRLKAIQLAASYAPGLPTQHVALTGQDGKPIDITLQIPRPGEE